jgi:hypothetical protein
VRLAGLAAWVAVTVLAAGTRMAVQLGPAALPPAPQADAVYVAGMQTMVDVIASLLHTHWRHERAASFGGAQVPRPDLFILDLFILDLFILEPRLRLHFVPHATLALRRGTYLWIDAV